MRNTLSFSAIPEQPGGGLLLQLAVILRQLNINPEGLDWTTFAPDGTLKVQLVLSTADSRWLPAVADHLRGIPGVREVRCYTETNPRAPASDAGEEQHQPFID